MLTRPDSPHHGQIIQSQTIPLGRRRERIRIAAPELRHQQEKGTVAFAMILRPPDRDMTMQMCATQTWFAQ